MLAGLKELKNRVAGMWQPWLNAEEADYWKIEYSAERHARTPQTPSPLTYEEEARLKTVKYH